MDLFSKKRACTTIPPPRDPLGRGEASDQTPPSSNNSFTIVKENFRELKEHKPTHVLKRVKEKYHDNF